MAKYLFLLSWFLMVQSDDRQAERNRMVRVQIEARGIGDQNVLKAMRAVLRHRLVPPAQVNIS